MLLVLDTSSSRGCCALAGDDGELLACSSWSAAQGHAEQLLPHLVALLEQRGVTLATLAGVVVDVGPGSFTGVRAAVATAKALSLAPCLPVVAIDALAALAMTDRSPRSRVALLDAHRGDLFVAVHAPDGERVMPPSLVPILEISRVLDAHPGAALVGARDVLVSIGRAGSSPDDDQRLASLARLGAARHARGQVDDAAALEPLYVRPPDLSLPRAKRV